MTKEQAKAAVTKHGSVAGAARKLGVPRTTFTGWLKGVPAKNPVNGERSGRSLVDFRALHDKAFIVPRKLADALKTLGDGWEYEVQFAKLAGVSLADLGNFRDQFAEHVVALRRDGKRAWAGTKAAAKKMREMVS